MYPLTWSASKTGTSNMASTSNVFKGSMSIVSCHLSILVYFNHVIKLAVNQYVSVIDSATSNASSNRKFPDLVTLK